jgi:hypothetical protein
MYVLHVLEGTLQVPANQLCVKAFVTLPQFECSLSVERGIYFLKKSAVLFLAVFTKMLALKTEGHLLSPLGPGQMCAARCRQISLDIQFRRKIVDITKVTVYCVAGCYICDHNCIVKHYCGD